MRLPRVVTIDTETFPIEGRPRFPPVPVGVSIKRFGKPARYWRWGHVTGGNNCTRERAIEELRKVWDNPDGLLFHNGRFDTEVIETHLGLPLPPPERYHDTLFLLFLTDPHAWDLGLKPSAKRLLGIEPEERDAVAEWIIKNQPVPGVKVRTPTRAAPYIAYAPGDIVEPYANGDVDRTVALFELLFPKIVDEGMEAPYLRERRLMPIFMDMERHGIRIDLARLKADITLYEGWQEKIDAWLRHRLRAAPEVNLRSDKQLLPLLIERDLLDTSKMSLTKKTGQLSLAGDSLVKGLRDPQLAAVLQYTSQLSTCLGTFMKPWAEVAEASGGLIFTSWNQVRSPDGGTRTGRLSSSGPNFQNIPKEFLILFGGVDDRGRKRPRCPWANLPPLPLCRSYVIPYDEGEVLVDRDYCFTPDTELLTERGFVRFDMLTRDVRVAQWNGGAISFDYPLHYQVKHFKGDLVHIIGDRSCDLLVTPSHKCLLLTEKLEPYFYRADAYAIGHHKQIGAGIKLDGEHVDYALIRFAVAVQADATVKAGGDRLVWKMKKTRKRERLQEIFNDLKLAYQEVPLGDQVTITTRASNVPGLTELIALDTKTFIAEKWRKLDQRCRLAFLIELAYWDGRANGDFAWSYFSTNVANVELACELACFTGIRANISSIDLRSGKPFATVNLRLNPVTWTDTYRVERVPYNDLTYCVTMPFSTVVVRRNGKIMITGQSQQEPRILAHFENGELMKQYRDNPWIDYHDNAKDNLERVFARPFKRKPVKNINLGIIYGQGIGSLAEKNGETYEDTKRLQDAILAMYPGLKTMRKTMKHRSITGEPIRTWGGRVYYCEPPRMIEGKFRTFDYKLVNVLVQGSAADCTKEALLRFYAVKKPSWRVLLQVHDELLISCPAHEFHECMAVLKETMESVEFDVAVLSEGSLSRDNWAALQDYDKKGQIVLGPTDLSRHLKGSASCLSVPKTIAPLRPSRSLRSNRGAGAAMTSILPALSSSN